MIQFAIQIVEQLSTIHDKGVTHEGINTKHILTRHDLSIVRFTDFGCSSQLHKDTHVGTTKHVNESMYELQYMSPEQTGRMNKVPNIVVAK